MCHKVTWGSGGIVPRSGLNTACVIERAVHTCITRMGEGKDVCRFLVGKPGGKQPPCLPSRRWEVNIKMDLQDVGWVGMDWIDLAQDRNTWRALVNAVMNLRVP